MANPDELLDQIVESAATTAAAKSRDKDRVRRAEAMQLRLAGLSHEAIGERLGVSETAVRAILSRAFDRAEAQGVHQLRAEENARLDRAQMAIWGSVLQGDLKAITVFLAISGHRAKINGLFAPSQVQVSMTIKQELEDALQGLEQLVLQEPVVVLEERQTDVPAGDRPADYA